jgi:hypothetical protein
MIDENIQTLLMYIGAFTCVGVAFLICCTMGFLGLLMVDGYQARRKAQFGKHQTSGGIVSLPNNEHVGFFNELEDVDARTKRQSEEAVEVLRERLTRGSDATMVQVPVKGTPGWDQVEYPFNMKGVELLDSDKPRHAS